MLNLDWLRGSPLIFFIIGDPHMLVYGIIFFHLSTYVVIRSGIDLKTVQALQRRHEGLERELEPLQEAVNRVNLLANS